MPRTGKHLLPILGLVASLGIFYASALDDYFYLDDFIFLERARCDSLADVLDWFSLENNAYGFRDVNHAYRPISTNAYFGTLKALFGPRPGYFHLANLLVLAANAVLVYSVLLAFGTGRWLAFLLGLLYATNEASFETQLWLSVSQDLLCVLFALATAVVYARWTTRGTPGWGAASLGLYVLAILSKEMAISLPGTLLFFHVLVRRDSMRTIARSLAPLVGFNAVYLAWRLRTFDLPTEGGYAFTWGGFLLENLGQYLTWSLAGLAFLSHPVAIGLVAAALLAGAIRATPRARRIFFFGAIAWIVSLTPVLFMPVHVYRYYLALPLVGLFVAIGGLLTPLARGVRGRAVVGIGAGVVLAFSASRYAEASAKIDGRARDIASLVEELRRVCPDPAPETTFYLALPETFPVRKLLKVQGSVVRVVYDDPTLRAFAVDHRRQLASSGLAVNEQKLRNSLRPGDLVYELDPKTGRLHDVTGAWRLE